MIENRFSSDTGGEPALSAAEWTALDRALELAAEGAFSNHGGNPRVGCVLLGADGSTIAEGRHRGAGTAHAEVVALRTAGERARGATAVVTLEPCAHHGRTGPCAEALITAGVRRVIFAQSDPNPIAAGGADRLRAAGIAVVGGVRADAATTINSEWTFAAVRRRPYVRLKIAGTLDGRVAAVDGSSRWITSAAAREDGHRRRHRSDVVLVGTGTVLADDPRLTVRIDGVESPDQPLRAVFGTTEIPAEAAIHAGPGEVLMLRTRSPQEALAALRRRGSCSVLIEGGPGVAASFLAAGLVDEVINYVAPVLLGAGPAAVGDLGLRTIGEALRGEITDVRSIGTGRDRCVRIITRLSLPAAEPDHEGAR